MHEHFNRLLDSIRNERKRFETLVRETCIIVVLLGAGGKEIRKRRSIARKLKDSGIIALIPEDDFAPDVAHLLDLYLTHIAKYGHVYAYDDSKESVFPTSKK
jgi:dihydrodipicolinate synthase/N-acetylneuraminate lyase